MVRRFQLFIFVLAFLALFSFGCLQSPSDAYSVQNGKMHYPALRSMPPYNATVLENTSNHTLTYLTFQSHGGVIVHALLRVPKTLPNGTAVSRPSVVLVLPGGSISKEGRQDLAAGLQDVGYASFTLDERGNGKTLRLRMMDQDFAVFEKGDEPEEAQMVYDALAGFDLLSEPEFGLDVSRVAVWGESMGGRYAVIAAALEPKLRGVVLVSSAGYGFPQGGTAEQTAFLRLVDPDSYVLDIAPRPVFFIHSPNDTTIPIASARYTFNRAGNPKDFTEFTCPRWTHGYCTQEDGRIRDYLARILG